MSLTAGIVGLPNVGKSTLFNAITKKNILIANYPFATIDPNVGVVVVPDERVNVLENMYKPERCIPTVYEFTDIAGLVKGASSGEGLGNKFLSHIREVDAIVEVVRCFDDGNVIHVDGNIDPMMDLSNEEDDSFELETKEKEENNPIEKKRFTRKKQVTKQEDDNLKFEEDFEEDFEEEEDDDDDVPTFDELLKKSEEEVKENPEIFDFMAEMEENLKKEQAERIEKKKGKRTTSKSKETVNKKTSSKTTTTKKKKSNEE